MTDYDVASIPAEWHTLESAGDQWRDAPKNPELLATLLWMAQNEVLAFAPALTPEDDGSFLIPPNYRYAQLEQARNTWNAALVDPSNGQVGDDSFQIRPFPLDWAIKQRLRPTKALPWVG